jgi:Cys-rich protein (TIGR01571 family)
MSICFPSVVYAKNKHDFVTFMSTTTAETFHSEPNAEASLHDTNSRTAIKYEYDCALHFFTCGMCGFLGGKQRTKIRQKLNIADVNDTERIYPCTGSWNDILSHLCCSPFALVQEQRELEAILVMQERWRHSIIDHQNELNMINEATSIE